VIALSCFHCTSVFKKIKASSSESIWIGKVMFLFFLKVPKNVSFKVWSDWRLKCDEIMTHGQIIFGLFMKLRLCHSTPIFVPIIGSELALGLICGLAYTRIRTVVHFLNVCSLCLSICFVCLPAIFFFLGMSFCLSSFLFLSCLFLFKKLI
jgi:hypothetical protein